MRLRTQRHIHVTVALMFGLFSTLPCVARIKPGSQVTTSAVPSSQASRMLDGQSRTLLPDGRVLLLGGIESGSTTNSAFLENPKTGDLTKLPKALIQARAYHTATLLPNGKVFIFGGVGNGDSIVTQAEIFNPVDLSFTEYASSSLTPRSRHTATLLTNGNVLIAGGLNGQGKPLDSVEIWNYRSGQSASPSLILRSPRSGHTASLLPDGEVFIMGGQDQYGAATDLGEVIDPDTGTTRLVGKSPDLPQHPTPPILEASIPQSGENGVSVDPVISLRFSEPMDVATVNDKTIVLTGPLGTVNVNVVPAEGGMLAFITPESPLQNGASYVLSISGVSDAAGIPLANATVLFSTEVGMMTSSAGETGGNSGVNPGTGEWSNGAVATNATSGFNSQWRRIPMLVAHKGATALAGQVLTMSGSPLPNVELEIGSQHAVTDNSGRFLLQNVGPGHHIMLVDGGPAGTKSAPYGIYRIGVDLKAGVTNSLNYVIWMTQLDTQHTVTISSPTVRDLIITNPNVPGVELHIPAGTVIRDPRGRIVTQIGITPIPTNQPPFPLKRGVTFPIYFTIQPGGASFVDPRGLHFSRNSTKRMGAQIYYQNRYGAKPGTVFAFWNYDPAQKAWYVYGHGRVSADGKMVVPDQNTRIFSFDGAMVALPSDSPASGPNGGPTDGEPVDLHTGLFVYTKTDLTLQDVIPLSLTRIYRQSDLVSRAFGIGTNLTYDMFLVGDSMNTPEGYTYQDLVFADGGKVHFTRTSPCLGANGYCDWSNAVYTATSTRGAFYGATLSWNGGGWTITRKDGMVYVFPDANNSGIWEQATLEAMHDRYGNSLTFTRDGNSNLSKITSPNGRYIQFSYTNNRVTSATDSAGRSTSYTYNSDGYLATATDANGGVTTYTYDTSGNMLTIQDPRGIVYLQNQYDVNDMVSQQTMGDGGVYQFSYTLDTNGNVTQTNITDPRGYLRTVAFNSDGYMTSDARAIGKPEAQTITYNVQQGTGLVLSMTDALNRETDYSYDAMGNLTSVTRLASTSNPAMTSFTYSSQFNELASITDPLGNETLFTYDSNGNMVTSTDPLGNTTSFTYNSAGQPLTITDPQGDETQLSYSTGILTSIADPLGRTTTRTFDGEGRITAKTDPLGHTYQYAYNPFDEVTSITDPNGGGTLFTYDGNGNRLTVTDANENTTTYTYDNMDRVQTVKDPLGNQSSVQYDLKGNVSQTTDRKSQVTTYAYDGLSRPTLLTYADGSTVTNTFDAGNRPTSIVDSISGTISRSYDGLNDLLSETTPQGSVAYTYDSAGRRQTMTVSGQPQVNYSFDNDNHLLSVAQSTADVSFNYDNDGRRTAMTLPNGITASYAYDAASELTSIVYQGANLAPSDLEYSYDQAGRRVGVSGSLASTQLPAAVSSAVYNANNQLTQWGSTAVTYDLNGNTLNDGTNTYTWDARNRLVSADSGAATFAYDALGRRIGKTIASANTNFLYDGVDPVQELNGTTPTANLLTGGIDERFTRTDASGTLNYITDALGSTVALTDTSGNSQVQYSYDPYGGMNATGSTTNSYTYTGREFDGLGLYYYRARYYDPATGRFISEDPIGFAGGINKYAYAEDSPTNFIDPVGTDKQQPQQPFWQRPGCADSAAILGVGLLAAAATLGAIATVAFLAPEAELFVGLEGGLNLAHIAPVFVPGIVLTAWGATGVAETCFGQ